MNELLVRLLPHCPNPVEVEERFGNAYVAEVCACPSSGPVHWLLDDGRPMHCLHGPRHPILHTTAGRPILTAVSGGIACASCASGLYSYHLARRVDFDGQCCYCGAPAKAGDGWYLKKHPALGVPGARR
ncbi:hypothetical protein ACFWG5_34795 [Streptomyces hydrogenans]|uniref:hypothetical protein n=1 Tax=Streptomyces TaxID=1883 RepID=UPI00362D0C72